MKIKLMLTQYEGYNFGPESIPINNDQNLFITSRNNVVNGYQCVASNGYSQT